MGSSRHIVPGGVSKRSLGSVFGALCFARAVRGARHTLVDRGRRDGRELSGLCGLTARRRRGVHGPSVVRRPTPPMRARVFLESLCLNRSEMTFAGRHATRPARCAEGGYWMPPVTTSRTRRAGPAAALADGEAHVDGGRGPGVALRRLFVLLSVYFCKPVPYFPRGTLDHLHEVLIAP